MPQSLDVERLVHLRKSSVLQTRRAEVQRLLPNSGRRRTVCGERSLLNGLTAEAADPDPESVCESRTSSAHRIFGDARPDDPLCRPTLREVQRWQGRLQVPVALAEVVAALHRNC